MSEYWVSHKKYFCRYCDIYIADDAPSKQQHENGMRHKGNKERFVRGLYKQGEKRKKDLDEEAREMARVEQAAQAAFAQDVNAGIAKLPSSTAPVASTSTAARKPPPKPTNAFSNYSTAESLGYQDPDAERLAAEAERRRMEGVAGDWQLLPPPVPSSSSSVPESGLKREAETPIDEEDNRQFKLRKKTLGVGLGEIYDPGVIPIKLKKKEESSVLDAGSTTSQPTEIPKWTKVQWKRPGDAIKEEATSTTDSPKTEDVVSHVPIVEPLDDEKPPVPESHISPKTESPVKPETDVVPNQTGVGSMFRKRKTPAGGNRGKRQL